MQVEKNKPRIWYVPGSGGQWVNYLIWCVVTRRNLTGAFDHFEFSSVLVRDPDYQNLIDFSEHTDSPDQADIVLGSNRAWMNFYLNLTKKKQLNNAWRSTDIYIRELQKRQIEFNLEWCDIWERPERFMAQLSQITGMNLPYNQYARYAMAQYSRTCVWVPAQDLISNRRLLLPQYQRQASVELRQSCFYPEHLPDVTSTANYCPLIFNGIYIEKVDQEKVKLSACCINHTSQPTQSIDFHHEYLEQQRDIARRGLPVTGCMHCYHNNNDIHANAISSSNGLKIDHDRPRLQKLDYNVDPICNARCIQCSSYYSSAWAAEDEKFGFVHKRKFNATRRSSPWQHLDLSQIEQLYFNGGEPLLSQEPEQILEHLAEIGQISKVALSLNTNGSQMPSDRLMELWKQCRGVVINFSIDGAGTEFEYIRNPLSWAVVEKNLTALAQESRRFAVTVAYTMGIHNIDCVEQTQEWVDRVAAKTKRLIEFNVHLCNGVLDLANAEPALKAVWLDRYQGQQPWQKLARSALTGPKRPQDRTWQQHLDTLDKRRNLDWRQALPGLYQSWKLSQARV